MEKWKKINKAPDYEVSTLGNIRRIGKSKNMLFDELRGYLKIDLRNNKRRCRLRVHRVVAEAFNKNYSEKLIVDHINRNRSDNRVENLRSVSQSDNIKNGIQSIGEVEHIIKLHQQGFSTREILDTLTYQ